MLIQRSIQFTLASQLQSNKVVLAVGARRAGKTVLLNQLANSFDGVKLLLNGDDLSAKPLTQQRHSL